MHWSRSGKILPVALSIVLVIAVLITHISYIIGSKETDMTAKADDIWLNLIAVGSTILSVISAGYMLQDAGKQNQ